MTTKQAAGIIRMLLGYLKGEIEPPKQETIEEARAFEQQGYECLEMAIKALEQQPCEDCISREAVNDGFKKYAGGSFAYGCVWDYINKLPSVTPEPPEDDDRKCMRCKHCIKREGPGWANPYGCDAWTCKFEEKEEEA